MILAKLYWVLEKRSRMVTAAIVVTAVGSLVVGAVAGLLR